MNWVPTRGGELIRHPFWRCGFCDRIRSIVTSAATHHKRNTYRNVGGPSTSHAGADDSTCAGDDGTGFERIGRVVQSHPAVDCARQTEDSVSDICPNPLSCKNHRASASPKFT